MDTTERVDWWSLTDEQLRAQCDEDRYRARGPGGQHRNKTDSAIRLRHRPTGLMVVATERRSQHENRARALKRLREALAFNIRQTIHVDSIPEIVTQACASGLHLSERDCRFLTVAAHLLDLLDMHQGRLAELGDLLGVSTGALVRFLDTVPELWVAAQQIRAAHHQKPLR